MVDETERSDDPQGTPSQEEPNEDGKKDEVQEQSEESFPASDPPSY